MKQINYFALLLTVLLLSVTFVACSKDDDVSNSKEDNITILGYWIEDPAYNDEENIAYVFQSSGKYIELWYHYDEVDEELTGTYDISGGRLSLHYDGDKEGKDYSDSHDKIVFTESKMILTEEDGDRYIYHKVSSLSGYPN